MKEEKENVKVREVRKEMIEKGVERKKGKGKKGGEEVGMWERSV